MYLWIAPPANFALWRADGRCWFGILHCPWTEGGNFAAVRLQVEKTCDLWKPQSILFFPFPQTNVFFSLGCKFLFLWNLLYETSVHLLQWLVYGLGPGWVLALAADREQVKGWDGREGGSVGRKKEMVGRERVGKWILIEKGLWRMKEVEVWFGFRIFNCERRVVKDPGKTRDGGEVLTAECGMCPLWWTCVVLFSSAVFVGYIQRLDLVSTWSLLVRLCLWMSVAQTYSGSGFLLGEISETSEIQVGGRNHYSVVG